MYFFISLHLAILLLIVFFSKEDVSKFHMRLANPFAVKYHGKIVLRFLDNNPTTIHSYIWEKNKFAPVEL